MECTHTIPRYHSNRWLVTLESISLSLSHTHTYTHTHTHTCLVFCWKSQQIMQTIAWKRPHHFQTVVAQYVHTCIPFTHIQGGQKQFLNSCPSVVIGEGIQTVTTVYNITYMHFQLQYNTHHHSLVVTTCSLHVHTRTYNVCTCMSVCVCHSSAVLRVYILLYASASVL